MIEIRRATVDDALIISSQRRGMFEDMGYANHPKLDTMEKCFQTWVADKLAKNEYLAWLITDDERVVAGVGLWIREWLPLLDNLTGIEAYVSNVYTDPAYRRQGLARQLMNRLMDYCKEQGIIRIYLYATDQGEDLYLSLGFRPDHPLRWSPPEGHES